MKATFADRVLRWFRLHGRKDLPWQLNVNAYRVWVSEIMLQQTQVATVIPYFERFMRRFPEVCALADASEDEVLHHWSGLGYYARARNLHRAAKIIRDEFDSRFPSDFDKVTALPGVGRSTAGAILSLSGGQRLAILDGNVKRVLARHAGIDGWPGQAAVNRSLWECAETKLPEKYVAAYNQAMMDLGATVCHRSRPACDACPVSDDCVARIQDRQEELPGRKPRKTLPEKHIDMLLLAHRGRVLLEKRPPTGIWGGLWSLPEREDGLRWMREQPWRASVAAMEPVTHTFSHFRLHIRPLHVTLDRAPGHVTDAETVWYDTASPQALGFAAPVRKILQQFQLINGERDGTHG